MSLKKLYFNNNVECCYTCMYIDEYFFNVHGKGKIPHGYDGMALCCVFDENEEESADNRLFISPMWKACKKYKKCTERQADYLDIFDENTQTIIKNADMAIKDDEK